MAKRHYRKLIPMDTNIFLSDEAMEIDSRSMVLGKTFITKNPGDVNMIFKKNYSIITDPVEAYEILQSRLIRRVSDEEPLIIYLKNGFKTFFQGLTDPLFRMPLLLNVCYVYDKPDISAHGGLDLRSPSID